MASDLTYMKWHVRNKVSIIILGSLTLNIKLAACTSLNYVTHVVTQLTSDMTKYCEAFPEESYNPRPNEICIARFEGKYYKSIYNFFLTIC